MKTGTCEGQRAPPDGSHTFVTRGSSPNEAFKIHLLDALALAGSGPIQIRFPLRERVVMELRAFSCPGQALFWPTAPQINCVIIPGGLVLFSVPRGGRGIIIPVQSPPLTRGGRDPRKV